MTIFRALYSPLLSHIDTFPFFLRDIICYLLLRVYFTSFPGLMYCIKIYFNPIGPVLNYMTKYLVYSNFFILHPAWYIIALIYGCIRGMYMCSGL